MANQYRFKIIQDESPHDFRMSTTSGLHLKVEKFFREHQDIEIVDTGFNETFYRDERGHLIASRAFHIVYR